MTIEKKNDLAKDTAAPKEGAAAAAKEAPAAKSAKKTMTDGQKLKVLVAAAKANGWSLPDEIEDED